MDVDELGILGECHYTVHTEREGEGEEERERERERPSLVVQLYLVQVCGVGWVFGSLNCGQYAHFFAF
jgi:hypothetical protein